MKSLEEKVKKFFKEELSLCVPESLDSIECEEVMEICLKALSVQEQITEIVNRQLIAGKNNYKEVYECFHEIVDIVQDNYQNNYN